MIIVCFKVCAKLSIYHDECCSFALQDGKLIETGVHPDKPIALSLCFERFNLGDLGFEVSLEW